MNKEEALLKCVLPKEVRFYEIDQIVYPVGEEKDALSISTWLQMDPETCEIKTHSQAVKNWPYSSSSPRYKLIWEGTYEECLNAIKGYILVNY